MATKADLLTACNQMSRLAPLMAIAAAATVGILGCEKGPKTVTVNGTITYNGKNVSDGIINFIQPKGRPLGGGINSDGTYSVNLPPGDYQVRIDAPAPLPEGYKEGTPLPKLGPPLVPEKYASFNTSGLVAKIDDQHGAQLVDFKLP